MLNFVKHRFYSARVIEVIKQASIDALPGERGAIALAVWAGVGRLPEMPKPKDVLARFCDQGMTELEAATSYVDFVVDEIKRRGVVDELTRLGNVEVTAIIEDIETILDNLLGKQWKDNNFPRFFPHNGKLARHMDDFTLDPRERQEARSV